MIQVDDLSKSYGAVAALRAVTFEIENGEIVRLLGRNYVVTSSASRFYALVSAYDVGRLGRKRTRRLPQSAARPCHRPAANRTTLKRAAANAAAPPRYQFVYDPSRRRRWGASQKRNASAWARSSFNSTPRPGLSGTM